MEVRKLLTLQILVLLTACSVGEYGDTGTGGSVDASATSGGGEASFNAMIKPLAATCVSCHSGGQPPNLTSFAALQDKYKMKPGSANILVIKGAHQGVTYFAPADQTTVQNWIDGL